MDLLVDMNLTPRWVPCLVAAGHTAQHWSSIGQPTASDHEIMAYARDHKLIVLTNDLDYPQILAHTHDSAPSVILVRGEPLVPEARGPALLKALEICKDDLSQGAIVSLDLSDRPRARVLPL